MIMVPLVIKIDGYKDLTIRNLVNKKIGKINHLKWYVKANKWLSRGSYLHDSKLPFEGQN